MKLMNFIIFLTIFLTLYGLVNYYIYIRAAELFSPGSYSLYFFTAFFIVVSLSYFLGRIFEKASICVFSGLLIWAGSIWMAFMLYLVIPLIIVDLARLGDRFLHYIPDLFHSGLYAKRIVGAAVICLSTMAVFYGYLNSSHPRIKSMTISINGKKTPLESLNIVMVSDIHLGVIISNSRLLKMVDSINDLHPDIVLLAGDVVDEDIAPVIENNLGKTLGNLKSKYGVFAITGNHEYIGGVEPSVHYLSDHGVRLLRDETLLVGDAFTIVGREDRSMEHFNGHKRKELKDLVRGIRRDLPIIMMDHQPFGLEDAVNNSIDLQLSGHTHHGQLWPINYITSLIYRISYGYETIGTTQFYVSSGFGTWGPPVRTGSRSEIVNIHIRFHK